MSLLKDGVRKDFLWLVVALMAFVLGYAIRGEGDSSAEVESTKEWNPRRDRPRLTALPEPVTQPRPGSGERANDFTENGTIADPGRLRLQEMISDRNFLTGLLQLTDRDLEKVPEVIDYLRAHDMVDELSDMELHWLVKRYRAVDPDAAIAWMSELEAGPGLGMVDQIRAWARSDPEAARKWMETRGRENYDHLAASYAYGLREVDPAETARIVATIGDDDLRENLERLAAGGVVTLFAVIGETVRLKVE